MELFKQDLTILRHTHRYVPLAGGFLIFLSGKPAYYLLIQGKGCISPSLLRLE